MSEQQNNKCNCIKKVGTLEKQVKEIKSQLEKQQHTIETLIKVLKRG